MTVTLIILQRMDDAKYDVAEKRFGKKYGSALYVTGSDAMVVFDKPAGSGGPAHTWEYIPMHSIIKGRLVNGELLHATHITFTTQFVTLIMPLYRKFTPLFRIILLYKMWINSFKCEPDKC